MDAETCRGQKFAGKDKDMLARGVLTPIGICRQCVLIRPGVFYVMAGNSCAVLCFPEAAQALLTPEILQTAQSWQEWLWFSGSSVMKIFHLWPKWRETLEQERHIVVARTMRTHTARVL